MKKVSIYQVDAFTGKPFAGNPAGVVPEAEGLVGEELQLIAREMNLSETAFVTRSQDAGADFDVRFFTPVTEVDLCGHATIATFHLLAELGRRPGIRKPPPMPGSSLPRRGFPRRRPPAPRPEAWGRTWSPTSWHKSLRRTSRSGC